MVTPFKVIFRQPEYIPEERITKEKEIPVINFVTDEMHLYKMTDEEIPEVIENKRLVLEFTSDNEEARFYMDGLDTLSIRFLEVGEDNKGYIAPNDEILTLLYDTPPKNNQYHDKTNVDGYYPFIPGYYRIKVIIEDISYYSWLKVNPKQLTEAAWVEMRNDIEETLHGLAQDLIHKNASQGLTSDFPIPIHILRKLYIIKNDFSKWVTALKTIQSNPRMRIRKEYNLVPEGKASNINAASIRYRARHPESRDYIYHPKNVRSYDLVENQWIRKILQSIVKDMNELLSYLKTHMEKIKQEIKREQRYHHDEHVQVRLKSKVLDELLDYERVVRRMRGECLPLLHSFWMNDVKETEPMSIPQSLTLDPRYRQLFSLYRALRNKEVSISLDTNYNYYWKRTDLLYEIWGFIQLMRGLQHESVGFTIVKGWIYETPLNSKSFQVPFLEAGTEIEFKKGNIKLNLVYDQTLPFKKEDTIITKPIFSNSNHTRPDARMDLYKDHEYIGTIMLDFKYRPLRFVWDSSKLRGSRQTDTMRQLISYRNNIDSPFLYRHKYPGQWHRYRPVHEVWGVYPFHEENKAPKDPMENYRVRLMELTPLQNKDNFYQSIADAIEKVIDAY
ncbi:DUF2357 domain-containing protein [Priestia megaterium]